jgi:hypothetical protein
VWVALAGAGVAMIWAGAAGWTVLSLGAWGLARAGRTFVLPDLSLYSGRALAPPLAAAFCASAADGEALAAAAAAAAGNGGGSGGPLLSVPVAAGLYGGGRPLLELSLTCASAALASPWAGSSAWAQAAAPAWRWPRLAPAWRWAPPALACSWGPAPAWASQHRRAAARRHSWPGW